MCACRGAIDRHFRLGKVKDCSILRADERRPTSDTGGNTMSTEPDPEFRRVLSLAEHRRVYGDPTMSDAEKVRGVRRGQESERDGVDAFFAPLDERGVDESVDPLTPDTLRWYIHEERDSRELLRAAYARVEGGATAV